MFSEEESAFNKIYPSGNTLGGDSNLETLFNNVLLYTKFRPLSYLLQ